MSDTWIISDERGNRDSCSLGQIITLCTACWSKETKGCRFCDGLPGLCRMPGLYGMNGVTEILVHWEEV